MQLQVTTKICLRFCWERSKYWPTLRKGAPLTQSLSFSSKFKMTKNEAAEKNLHPWKLWFQPWTSFRGSEVFGQRWSFFLRIFLKWPLGELDFESRASERKYALEFGNHTKEPWRIQNWSKINLWARVSSTHTQFICLLKVQRIPWEPSWLKWISTRSRLQKLRLTESLRRSVSLTIKATNLVRVHQWTVEWRRRCY